MRLDLRRIELPDIAHRFAQRDRPHEIGRTRFEFQRDRCKVVFSNDTRSTMSPPERNGGIRSSKSRLPYSTPIPVGA